MQKKNDPRLLFLSCMLLLTVCGCYYNIEEELYQTAPLNCDASNVTYANTINTILVNNGCTGCHGGGFPSGNFSLEGHAQVKAKVSDGTLWGAINHLPGFSPMPQGGNKLNSC